jgi:hypothetical protein
MDNKNQLLNTGSAQISKVEFAQVEEGVLVRITCSCGFKRPFRESITTHVVYGLGGPKGQSSRAIQEAISELRGQHGGTKILLDPDAILKPLNPNGRWTYQWEEALTRARIGLNQLGNVQFNEVDSDTLSSLEEADRKWILAHSTDGSPTNQNGTASGTPRTKGSLNTNGISA